MSGISVVGVTSPVPLEDLAAPVSKGAFVVGDGPGNSPEEVILATDKIFFGDPGPATGVSQATLTSFARTLIDDTTAVIALATLGALDPAGISGGQTVTGGSDFGDDLIFASTSNATKGVVRSLDSFEAKAGILLDGLGASDKIVTLDRADTTTPSNIRWTEGGDERWALGVLVGTQDLTLNNTNSTGDFLVTPLGSVIAETKTATKVALIARGASGQSDNVFEAQDNAEAVVASVSSIGKGTYAELQSNGIVTLAKGSQNYVFRDEGENLVLQGGSATTATRLYMLTNDGDGTDDINTSLFGLGTVAGLGTNRERLLNNFDAFNDEYQIFTDAAGTGVAHALHVFVGTDRDQLVTETNSTISSQGVTIIDATGQHVGTWAGTAVAVAVGGTGATTAAGARTNLGLVIGVDVQADLDLVSQVDAEAGTATDERVWSALRVKQAVVALGSGAAFGVNTATQSFASDTTLADVTDLTVPIAANEKLHVKIVIYTSTGIGGLKLGLNGPSGFTSLHYIVQPTKTTGVSTAGQHEVYDGSTGESSSSLIGMELHATIINGGTAGNIVARAAQNSSNVASSDILRDSFISGEIIT